MEFNLPGQVRDVLMLGAGASVDYGLPVWDELSSLIKEKMSNDKIGVYQYKKEIQAWIDKVGEKKEYSTIDQCIQKESVSKEFHTNGPAIENQIFLIIKDIFAERYKEGDGGWIRKLNEKFLELDLSFGNKIAFINYNYDDVLEKNLLNFEHLPDKHKRLNHREKLKVLSQMKFASLYPHGNLFAPRELPSPSRVVRVSHTMKTGVTDYVDAVSCYESEYHTVVTNAYVSKLDNLYILGLGGGLEVNLKHLSFDVPISEIHVTIKNASRKDNVIGYLSKKFKKPVEGINVYDTCKDLIENCF